MLHGARNRGRPTMHAGRCAGVVKASFGDRRRNLPSSPFLSKQVGFRCSRLLEREQFSIFFLVRPFSPYDRFFDVLCQFCDVGRQLRKTQWKMTMASVAIAATADEDHFSRHEDEVGELSDIGLDMSSNTHKQDA